MNQELAGKFGLVDILTAAACFIVLALCISPWLSVGVAFAATWGTFMAITCVFNRLGLPPDNRWPLFHCLIAPASFVFYYAFEKHAWSLNEFAFKKMPEIWERFWGARLMATTSCSEWLSESNQDFTCGQRLKRDLLTLFLFAAPGRRPLQVKVNQNNPHSH